jgi:outer membrane protein TolC
MRRLAALEASCALLGMSVLCGCIASEPDDHYRAQQRRALGAKSQGGESNSEARGTAAPAPAAALPELRGYGPLSLSVEQTLLLAMRQNRSLSVQSLQAHVTGAHEAIERGEFDPELFARAELARGTASEATNVTGEQFSVRGESDSLRAGVRQRLPTGTNVELSAARERGASSRRPELYEARVGLTVTQALLRGFGPSVTLARVHTAEADTLASLWELRGFTEALLAEAESTYWRHALAQESLAIVERSLEVTAEQLREVEQFVAVGKLAPFVAAPLRAEVAQREQDLIDAQSARQVERLRLSRLMGIEVGGATARELSATSDPRVTPEPLTDLTERIELALRLRADLNEARMRVQRGKLETVMTRNGLLPQLDLFVTLGKSGYAASFGGAFDDLSGENYDFAAGLELTYALGSRSASGRDAVARYTARQAEASVQNLAELVELDVRTAAVEVERARRQIGASAATRTFREQSVRAQVERLRVGSATALDLAQAQRDLVESELQEVRAMIEYRLARVALYRAEGSLLDRRGIEIAR